MNQSNRANYFSVCLSLIIVVFYFCADDISLADTSWMDVFSPIEEVQQERQKPWVEIGLRSVRYSFKDPTRPEPDENGDHFLGSIDELKEDQRTFPLPFLRWEATSWLALDIGYERRRAITRTYHITTDGTIDLQGPSFAIQLTCPFIKQFKPYVEMGRVPFNARFRHADWWHYGFPADDAPDFYAWLAEGRPPSPSGGYQRKITLSDTTGKFYGGGARLLVTPYLSIEFGVRTMRAETKAHYLLLIHDEIIEDRGKFPIPMDNRSYHVGMSYLF